MEFLNQLLAGLVQSFKTKNPQVFTIVVTALLVVFVACQSLISGGVFEDSALLIKIVQFIDVAFMALMGSKTSPYLKEFLDQVSVQQNTPDSWWTTLIDSFKMKSPLAYGIIATVLVTFFVSTQYAMHFGIIPEGSVATVLQIAGYVDIAVLILLGSRTGKYILEHPIDSGDTVSGANVRMPALYYD